MASKKAVVASPPPQGNEFVYYVPSPPTPSAGTAAAAAAPLPKPIPVSKANAALGKGTYQAPNAFIAKNFSATLKANFGAKQKLDKHRVIRRVDIVRAALEGGYGRRSNWSTALVLNKTEAVDLARYLVQRLQLVTVCVEPNKSKALELRSFYDRVEASEKTALSFVLGGMGAFLAAKEWLSAGGDPIRSFLHVGIFTTGIAGSAAAISFKSGSKKIPDYLVESQSGAWHVFESKGGKFVGRWARLCEGLAQLENVPKIGWAGKVTTSPLTCVCVHTSVDPGQAICVTAVDPPGEENGVDGGGPLVLIQGVCRLLLMLETLEQFLALADAPAEAAISGLDSDWQQATSSLFGGLHIAIPSRYAEREDEVRQRLAVFFAIRKVLSELSAPSNAADYFVSAVSVEVNLVTPADMPVKDWTFELGKILDSLVPHLGSEDFLLRCSQELGLEELASELMPSSSSQLEPLFLALSQGGEHAVTSAGLFLQVRTEASSNDER